MFDRWFLAHPRSVGETYFEHQRAAAGFGGALVCAGAACLVHALAPPLFRDAATKAVARLHARLSARQVLDPQDMEAGLQ